MVRRPRVFGSIPHTSISWRSSPPTPTPKIIRPGADKDSDESSEKVNESFETEDANNEEPKHGSKSSDDSQKIISKNEKDYLTEMQHINLNEQDLAKKSGQPMLPVGHLSNAQVGKPISNRAVDRANITSSDKHVAGSSENNKDVNSPLKPKSTNNVHPKDSKVNPATTNAQSSHTKTVETETPVKDKILRSTKSAKKSSKVNSPLANLQKLNLDEQLPLQCYIDADSFCGSCSVVHQFFSFLCKQY